MINEKRTVIIRDAELHWAKLGKPVAPFGTLQWEIQMRTKNKATAEAWKKEYYLPVKTENDDDEGTYYKVNLKRKAVTKDGKDNTPPEVVNGAKQPIDSNSIGNGSVGNVMIFQYPYDVAGRKGVSSILSKVQVIDHKVYTPNSSIDFDLADDVDVPEEAGTDF